MIGDVGRDGGECELVAVTALTLAILNVFLCRNLRAVVLCQIHGHHVTACSLTQQSLLRRKSDARLARWIVEPEIVAVLQHQLVGIARRCDETNEAAKLSAGSVGFR